MNCTTFTRTNNSLRRGFTLVEMLVSVALVLLMMTLFTSIFQMATNSVSKQRVIAETDQRARSLTTILRADFAKRSFRTAFPFLPNESSSTSVVPFGSRTGYIYISCNDPASGQDDLIQFTVDARQVQTNPDSSLYYGAAKQLWDKLSETAGDNTNPALQFSPNQPEADEGDMVPNGASGSNAAEISLFLRGGNLIRRVMLLREPLPVSGLELETQPKSALGRQYFLNTAASQVSGQPEFFLASAPAVAQSDFWRHFDFAAVPANMANVPDGLNFIGIDALANDQSTVVTSLGQPRFRFGFNPVTGMSREHESVSPSARFIGRYLHAETSADFAGEDFNWPLRASSIGNPMDVTNSVTLSPTTGIVNEFDGPFGRGGMRRVEDVLLANVREFRVELWDSRLERWVVPGHQIVKNAGTPQAIAGDYHITRCWQRYSSTDLPNPDTISYGPLQIPASTVTPHVFDTWHPQIIRNINGNGVNELAERQAPYFPLKFYPPDQDGSTTRSGEIQVGPSSFRNPDPRAEFDPTATLPRSDVNQGYWRPSTTYQPGDVVFADRDLTPGWDANSDGVFDWSVDSAAIPKESLHYAYRCVGVVDTNFPPNSGTTVPGWQSPGLRFVDGNLLWEGFSNISPLKAVRLTIRFIEPTSETLKQLTLVMPITDEER